MTEQEREELKKLSTDELIDILDEYKTDAEKKRAEDRREIINKFLRGEKRRENASEDENEDEDGADVFDLKNNTYFQRLKKRLRS